MSIRDFFNRKNSSTPASKNLRKNVKDMSPEELEAAKAEFMESLNAACQEMFSEVVDEVLANGPDPAKAGVVLAWDKGDYQGNQFGILTAKLPEGGYETLVWSKMYYPRDQERRHFLSPCPTVELYDTKEEALEGHKRHLSTFATNPPKTVVDLSTMPDAANLDEELGSPAWRVNVLQIPQPAAA